MARPPASRAEILPQGTKSATTSWHRPYPLCGRHVSWAVGHFYALGHWRFASREEHQEFFVVLVEHFDERWQMRETIFPHLPLNVVLDDSQLEELEKKKLDLYFVSPRCAVTCPGRC